MDAMNVALVVGGSIVIPHLRHAALSLEDRGRQAQPGQLGAAFYIAQVLRMGQLLSCAFS